MAYKKKDPYGLLGRLDGVDSTEETNEQEDVRFKGFAHDSAKITAAGAPYRSDFVGKLEEGIKNRLYKPNMNDDLVLYGARKLNNLFGLAADKAIGKYSADTAGTYKVQKDMDIGTKSRSDALDALLRARSGDMNILSGLDEDDPNYALYKRLLRLSGYDDVTRAYGATELPVTGQRNGMKTYADLFAEQQDYTRERMMDDVGTVSGFVDYGGSSPATAQEALDRLNRYFGGDLTFQSIADEKANAPFVDGYRTPWYQDEVARYDADTQSMRDVIPDGDFDYDGYVQHMQDLAKQKKADEEAQARYNEWKTGFDSKWGNLSQAEDYDSYVRQRYYPNQYGGGWSEDQQLYENIVYGLYTKTADDTDLLTQGTGYEEKGYHMMTPEERDAYAYLFNQRGADSANEYLSDLQPELWRRRSIKNTQDNAEWAGKNAVNGVLGAIAARGGNLMNDVTGVLAGIHSAFGGKLDAYDPIFDYGRNAQTFDSVNSQNIRENTQWANIGNVNPFQIVYGGLTSAADSFLAGGLFGATGGSLAQAAGAGSTALREGLESGKSYNDALMDAIATGTFEALTEKFSMDALFKGGTSGVKNIVRNMITEPSEEIMNLLLNLGYDRARYGTDDALGTRMSELRTQGYTEPEARVQLLMELGGKALETALTAWVAGTTSGTVSAASTYAENKGIGKQIQENETTSRLLEIADGLQGMPEDVRAMIEDQKAALQATFRNAFDSEQEAVVSEAQSEEAVEEEPEAVEEEPEATEEEPEATEEEPEATEEPRKVVKKVTETAEQLRRKALEKQDAFQAAMDAVAQKFGSAEDAIKAANEMREAQEAADRAEAAEAAEAAEDSSVAPDEVTEYAQEETEEVLPDLASDVARNSSNEAVPEAASEAAEETTETAEKAAPKRPDTKKKKTPKLNDAKLGRIYRETMSRLDEQAQALVEGNFAETSVRKALQRYAFLDTDSQGRVAQRDKPMQQLLEKVTSKAIYSAEKLTEQERSVLLGSKAAMRAVGEFTGIVPRDGDTERKRIRSAAEELYSLAQPKSKTAAEAAETSETGAAAEPQDVSVTVDEASELAPAEAEQVVKEVASAYGSNADIVSGAYEQGQNVAEYATAFRTAYEYGQDGRNLENIKTSSALSVLNDNQIRTAYELGRGVRRTAAMPGQKQYRGVPVGNVDTSALKGMKLNGTQQKSVGAIRRLAEAVGFNVEFIASAPNEEGKYTTKNGSWNSSTRMMTVDINAGRISAGDANYAMMQTVGHELTHFIADFADSELFNDYQEFVFGHLSEKMDEDVLNDRIQKIIEGNAKQGKTLTREQAAIEVVADASGDALLSLTEADIRELAQTKPTLLQKIADYIQKWTKKVVELIRKAYDGQGRNSISEQMVDVAEEMGRKWVELLKDANARTTHTEVYEAQKAEQTQERQNQATTLRQQDGNFLAYNHIDQRTAETVRSVDTQLFCSEVEEATLYYAAAANMLLHDVEGSVSGQKFFTGDGEVTGQKRMTSDFIARVKDSTGWTWEKIRNSIEQFAAMESGEQLPKNTVTNREMELYLDEVLSNGYTTTEGVKVAPADDYVAAKAQYRGSAGNAAPRSAYEGAVDFMEYAFGDVAYSVREGAVGVNSAAFRKWFKDSKVVNPDGSPKVMYHGSPNTFTVFDKRKARSSGLYGRGFYFTDSASHGSAYGSLYQVYLSIQNPLTPGGSSVTRSQVRKFLEAVAENEDDYSIENYGTYDVGEILKSVYSKDAFAVIQDVNATAIGDMVEAVKLFNEVNGTDYDGIVVDTETVAFEPNQIKSATDNVGTFDPESDDIRYSVRDTDSDDLYQLNEELKTALYELQELETVERNAQNDPELMDAMMALVEYKGSRFSPEGKQRLRELKAAYTAIADKLNINGLGERKSSIEGRIRDIRQRMDALETELAQRREDEAIRKSGMPEADFFRKRAVKEFGYTAMFVDAGYMLSDSKMLNFSGEKGKHFGTRGQDHRAIGVVFENTTGSKAMLRFMNYGNIRVMAEAPGIDISNRNEPTAQQYTKIKAMVREYAGKRFFSVDISDENGMVVGSYTYDGNVNADRVVNDIKHYFATGEFREHSRLSDFMDDSDVSFSVRELDDGTQYTYVEARDIDVASALDTDSVGRKARLFMREHFRGVVLPLGKTKAAYVRSDSINEYTNPAKFIDDHAYDHKMLAATELDNLLKASRYVGWKPDDGHHKDAVRGWTTWETMFVVHDADDNTGVYSGEVKIKRVARGDIFHDITHIKNITNDTMGRRIIAESQSVGDNVSISDFASDVNQLRDPDLISDREILANVMESAATNADELDHVRRYRKRIATLNELQTQLDETNAALADARKRGAKKEQAALMEKANGIARKLDREDGMLLKYESGKLLQAVVKRQREQLRRELNRKASQRAQKRMKEVRQQDREHYEERIRQLRAEKNAKLDELRREKTDAVAKVRAEKNESFARAQYLGEVQKHAKRLMELLTTPTNKAHVPEFLRRPLGDFVTALDFSSVTKLKGGSDTKGDERLKDAMSDLATALRRVHNQQFGDQTTGAEFFGGYLDLPGDFLDTFDELMAKIRVSLKTSPAFAATPVNKMTSEQLHDLAKVFRLLHSSIANMNRLISNAKYASAVTAANDTMTDLEAIRDKRSHSELAQKVSSFLDWKNTVPYYVFKRFGRGGMAIFEGLMDGWDKLAHNSDELVKFADKAYNVSEVREWEREVQTVELASGNTVSMTTAQMMSVYCLAKREQARGHLLGGGIRVADIGSRGKVIRQVANHLLTDADLKAIAKQLTPRQREVADALQGYMSTKGSEWGNYVSMKRFGYEMFTEEHYFPIETDPNNRAAQDEKSEGESLYRLLNMSATKGLTKGANNAIVVRSIFDVFTAHMTDMAKYNALGLQLLDTFKWFNYVERTQNKDGTVETRTTQKALEEAYGGDARSYIMQFLRDLNGVSEGGREDGFINKATSNYKIASTAANLRVGILQITSMPRAAYVINPKYLAVGLAKWNTSRGKNSAKAAEEVGIAKWKSMGFYDTNINRSVRKMVKHDENWREKAQGWSTKLAEWGDAWTMGVLYGAVEAEMKDKHPSVQPGSKAYRELFNRRMREIVYQTQVVDSTMTRSQLMRSKGLITLATSFMSEPTLAMNMLNDAIFEARVKAREGKNWFPAAAPKVARAFGTTTFVIGLSSVIEALFTAYRDDDEFETFAEKLTKAFFGESFWDGALGGNLNLLNNLPLIKDVIAAAQGDTSDAMYSAWAKTMYDGLKTLYTVMVEGGSDADIYRGVYKTVNGMSQLTGIAAGGAMRELVTLYNTFVAEPYGWKRLQTYENTPKDAAKAIYAASLRGDADMVKFYRERASMYGLDAEKISKALATLVEADLNAGNIDSAAARRLLTGEAGKTADYAADLINDVEYEKATGLDFDNLRDDYAAGLLTESQVRSHLAKYGGLDSDEVEDKMSRYDYYIATGKTTTPPKYWRIAYAHETGGNYRKLAEDAIVDIIAGGRTEKQARRQIADSLESYYKADYLAVEGTPAGDRMLEDILDVYEAIGYTRDYERNYIAENWFD